MKSLTSKPWRAVAFTLAMLLGGHGAFAADDREVDCKGSTAFQPLTDSELASARALVMKPRPSEGLVAFLDRPAFEDIPWGNGTRPTYSAKPRIGFKDAGGKVVIEPTFIFSHPCRGTMGYGQGMATFLNGYAAVLTLDGFRFIDKTGAFVGDQVYGGLYLGNSHTDGESVWVASRDESKYFGLSSKLVKEDLDIRTLQASEHVAKPMKRLTITDTQPKAAPKGPTEGPMGVLGQSPFGSLSYAQEISTASVNTLVEPTAFIAAALWTLYLSLYLGWQLLQRLGVGVSIRAVLAVMGLAGAFLPIYVLGALCAVLAIALAFVAPKRPIAAA
jgi:hypothetical protein